METLATTLRLSINRSLLKIESHPAQWGSTVGVLYHHWSPACAGMTSLGLHNLPDFSNRLIEGPGKAGRIQIT